MKTIAELADRAAKELYELEMLMRAHIGNQNISDILAAARGKLQQVAAHPDAVTELDVLKPVPEPEQNTDQAQKPAEPGPFDPSKFGGDTAQSGT